jgi:hypothetical protein
MIENTQASFPTIFSFFGAIPLFGTPIVRVNRESFSIFVEKIRRKNFSEDSVNSKILRKSGTRLLIR